MHYSSHLLLFQLSAFTAGMIRNRDEWIVDAPLKTFHSGVNTDSYWGQVKDALGERPFSTQQRGHYKNYILDTTPEPEVFYGLQIAERKGGHRIKKFHDRRPLGYGLKNAENLAIEQDRRNLLNQRKDALRLGALDQEDMSRNRRGYGGQALQYGLNALGAGIAYNAVNRGFNYLGGQGGGYQPSRKRFRSGYERQIGNYGRYNQPPALPASTKLNWCPPGNDRELKFMDRTINVTPIDSGGEVYTGLALDGDICTIKQDTGASERIGRKVTIREIHWTVNVRKLIARGADSVEDTADEVRIMLVLDTQCNGALPAVADILAFSSAAGDAAGYQSFMNLTNKGRFVVLVNKRFCISTTAGAGNGVGLSDFGQNDVCWEWHKNVCIPIEYGVDAAGIAGTIAGVKANNLVCLTISKSDLCVMESLIRLRYDG